jgi:predicted SnoaL-like aldol condensation-catalyzing enzyme
MEEWPLPMLRWRSTRSTMPLGRAVAIVLLAVAWSSPGLAQPGEDRDGLVAASPPHSAGEALEERNKALARGFYEDLWFSDRTDRYHRYVADEYVVHDIGDVKAVTEPAIQQKEIADFLHSKGRMTGSIDFQIAEGDLVATRWQWRFEPTSLPFRLMGGREQIPIINVFRFRDGKIVEIWNHRHDIDTGRGNIPFVEGLGLGLLFALPGWGAAFFLWRRARVATRQVIPRGTGRGG